MNREFAALFPALLPLVRIGDVTPPGVRVAGAPDRRRPASPAPGTMAVVAPAAGAVATRTFDRERVRVAEPDLDAGERGFSTPSRATPHVVPAATSAVPVAVGAPAEVAR
ncbi:hypothetical protein [Umezawaea beigongshangensis]|uniref:hypothetical protein n=1 Tax=Umezawaea beigongshangensis TaxID=2780383 RepID=UPI0018F16E5D|nr:hypothetical protein [Umezawaea beigongshangensis]